MKQSVTLRHKAWYGDESRTLEFPEGWDVSFFGPRELPAMGKESIREKILTPIGGNAFHDLFGKKSRILLVCDDLSRPTRTDVILPVLLEILEGVGVTSDRISLMISSGSHGGLSKAEVNRKLGPGISRKYRVIRHHFTRGNVLLGQTSLGTPVWVNAAVTDYDLVMGIGSILPHAPAGFGGGVKIVLGISSVKTILHFHRERTGSSRGGDVDNEFRQDIAEAAAMAGLKYVINTCVNNQREVAAIFAGDPDAAFRAGVSAYREQFNVPRPGTGDYDLVISEAYPVDADYAFTRKGIWPCRNANPGALRLVISDMSRGAGHHPVFPVPNEPLLSRLQKIHGEMVAYGPRIVFERLLKRRSGSPVQKTGTSTPATEKGVPQTKPMLFLHDARGKKAAELTRLPFRFFDSPEACFRYIGEASGKSELKVAFYRNASLTFTD